MLPYSAWHLVAQSDIWFLFYFHLGRLWEVSIYLLEYHLCWRNTQFQSTHSWTWNFIIIANNSFEISIEKGSLAQVTMGLAGSGQNPGSPDFRPQDIIPSLPYPCWDVVSLDMDWAPHVSGRRHDSWALWRAWHLHSSNSYGYCHCYGSSADGENS